MSLKALADQWLERNGLRNDSGTIAENTVPLESQKTEPERNDFRGVERCETPVRSEPSPGSVPSPSPSGPAAPTVPIQEGIAALIEHCRRWGDEDIRLHIETHPGSWSRWGLDYSGIMEMMTELHPNQANRIPTEAARAVIAWIEYRDLERISNQEYREILGACWERLQKG